MKKNHFKFIYIIFVSIVCFCAFSSGVKANETASCSDKLLDCYYPVEFGKNGLLTKVRKYSIECYFDLNKKFQCTMHCTDNCSTYGYFIKQAPEESRFTSSGKYSCPVSLTYRTVNNSSDDIYFKKTVAEDPTYENMYKSEATLSSQCVKTGADVNDGVPHSCGYYGDNAFSFTISSLKDSSGNFTYQATYYAASPKGEYEISNINEVVKSKKVDSNGCPEKPFKLYSIVPDKMGTDGKMTYIIELTGPNGEEGQHEFGEYSGWQSYLPEKLTKKSHITVNNIFQVVTNKITCTGALSNTLPILKDIFKYIRIGAILLFLALTSFDYVKAIADSDQSVFKKSNKHLVTRAIILIAVLILPSVINLLLAIVQLSNGSCGIS